MKCGKPASRQVGVKMASGSMGFAERQLQGVKTLPDYRVGRAFRALRGS